MQHFICTVGEAKMKVKLSFNDDNVLVIADIVEPINPNHMQLFWRRILPTTLTELEEFGKFGKVKVEKVPDDLSFDRFWELYDYKVGKRDRAKHLYELLSDADKAKCLKRVPAYKGWLLQHPGIERLYPETFISQRRFDNEFK